MSVVRLDYATLLLLLSQVFQSSYTSGANQKRSVNASESWRGAQMGQVPPVDLWLSTRQSTQKPAADPNFTSRSLAESGEYAAAHVQ